LSAEGLDPVGEPHRVEDQRALRGLAVLNHLDQLELAKLDDLAFAFPLMGGIVEWIVVLGEGELQGEPGDAGAQPLPDLILQVVGRGCIPLLSVRYSVPASGSQL